MLILLPLSSKARDSITANVRLASLFEAQIVTLAESSSCAQTHWKSRGLAPMGYIKGMALTYARSLCRIKSSGGTQPVARILMAANSQNSKKDVLAYFNQSISRLGINVSQAGKEPLAAVYTVGMGLGMRESSGRYCEGWDKAAGSHRTSAAAEAGPFQASFDSMAVSNELNRLYQEYKASPEQIGRAHV